MLLADDQQPGAGRIPAGIVVAQLPAESCPCNPARTRASCMPVLTASPPLASASHQSMAEGSDGRAELYPLNKSRLPSGDQMGRRAVVRFGATRRGGPPAIGSPRPRRSPVPQG